MKKISYRADPDSSWSYVVLICAMINHFILFGIGMSFSVFFRVLMEYFHSTRATTAWFNSIQSGVFYFSGPIVSLLLKRYDWRVLIVAGGIINGLGLSLSFFANSIYFLYITIGLLVGFGYGCMHVPAVVAVGAYFTRPAQRSFAQGVSLAGGSLGTLIMPPIVYKLIVKYGFKGAFLILGALMFQTTVFGCLFLPFSSRDFSNNKIVKAPKPPSRKKFLWIAPTKSYDKIGTRDVKELKTLNGISSEANGTDITIVPKGVSNTIVEEMKPSSLDVTDGQGEVKDDHTGTISPSTLSPTWRSPRFLLFVAQSACWTASVFIVMHLLFDFLLADRGIRPPLRAAFLFTIIMTSAMAGNISAALLDAFLMFRNRKKEQDGRNSSDTFDPLRSLSKPSAEMNEVIQPHYPYLKSWLFIACTLAHGAIATPLFIATRRYELLCVIAVVFGFPYGIKLALGPTVCVDLFGLENLPHVYGYTMMASGVGILLSPPFGGYLVDITKSYHMTFGLSAILSIISAILYTILLLTEQPQRTSVKYQRVSMEPNDAVNRKFKEINTREFGNGKNEC
ncbi:monocarboxylate transporter 14-like isoform X2 [Gordionus sp. m RMFG-2023]|uniref:monocarboxylate transporter 14-like isoform X2 n=1 Tax=Gordionus sp. m RMFG-2023 TaxID=3053472 RepID=UPI0031FD4809